MDAGILGIAGSPSGKPEPAECRAWLQRLAAARARIVVPEVADYEVRRELVAAGSAAGLKRLDQLGHGFLYAPISTRAMRTAADLWAALRSRGLPTADLLSLDADAVLAGRALTIGRPGDAVTLATSNVRHLGRYPGLDARAWRDVQP